jgi:hypothetical protein
VNELLALSLTELVGRLRERPWHPHWPIIWERQHD